MLQILDVIIRSARFISASVVGIRYKVINSMMWLWVCRVDSWSAVRKSSSQHVNPDGHLQVRPGCCCCLLPPETLSWFQLDTGDMLTHKQITDRWTYSTVKTHPYVRSLESTNRNKGKELQLTYVVNSNRFNRSNLLTFPLSIPEMC